MTFQALQDRAEALRRNPKNLGLDGLYYRVNEMLASATENANDTLPDELQGSADYLKLELASLECRLCDCRDEQVTGWFRKQGFRW